MAFEVPYADVLSFAFDGPSQVDDLKPLYIDAENPARTLNKSQTRSLTKNFIAGLQHEGLQAGDCVLVVLFNNVSRASPSIDFSLISVDLLFFPVFRYHRCWWCLPGHKPKKLRVRTRSSHQAYYAQIHHHLSRCTSKRTGSCCNTRLPAVSDVPLRFENISTPWSDVTTTDSTSE